MQRFLVPAAALIALAILLRFCLHIHAGYVAAQGSGAEITYLLWKALACLLAAFVVGLLLGWWLGSRKLHDRLDRLEAKWRLKLQRRKEQLAECQEALETPNPGDALGSEAATDGGPQAAESEDLTKVEGIGPKIENLLHARGIRTWSRLAAAEVSFLQSVLDDAGSRYRLHNPATWPQQAALAADGAWDELKALQHRLKGRS